MTTPHDDIQRRGQFPEADDFFEGGGSAGSSQFKLSVARKPGSASQFKLPTVGGQGAPSQFRQPATGGLSASPQWPSQFKEGSAVGNTSQTPSQPLPAQSQSYTTPSRPLPSSGRPPSQPLTSGFQDASWLTDSRSSSSVFPATGPQNASWLTDSQSSISSTTGPQNASWFPAAQNNIPPTAGPQSVSWLMDSHSSVSSTTGQRSAIRWWLDEDSGESQSISPSSSVQTDGHLMVPWGLPHVTGERQAVSSVSTPDQAISGEQQSVTWRQGATDIHGNVAPQQMIITGQQGAVTWGVPAIPYASVSQNAFTWNDVLATGERSAVTWERPAEEAAALPESPTREVEVELPRLERYTPLLAFLLNITLVVLIMLSENTGAFIGIKSSLWPGSLNPSLNDITNNKTMSPLLFGTNMALFHDWDESILKSATTRQMLKDVGVRVIRMPTRNTLSDETQMAAANAIKAIGAVPLVVLSGPEYKDGDILARNKHLVSLIGGVFGNQPVYYEFGNESDLQGIKAEQYAQIWNQVIPSLKQMYPQARFIGPDMYQFNRRYLKTFVQNAKPRPDGISWHEYTCSVHWSAEFCLANIDSWPMHFAQARAAMREAIGTELPIWISEYNYASDQMLSDDKPIDDGKLSNPTFMQAWMTKAMQTLTEGHIYAALQYYATNPSMPLITSDGEMGIEGKIFQQDYKKIIAGGYTPESSGIIPAPSLKPGTQVAASFEGKDTAGWISTGGGISQTSITTAKAFDGKQSLHVTLTNKSEDDTPYISATVDKLPSVPKAGQMIHAYVFVANQNALVNAKLFVGDPGGNWYYTNDTTLTAGQWNHLWYTLPSDFNGSAATLGIQFYTAKPGVSSDVYVDALHW